MTSAGDSAGDRASDPAAALPFVDEHEVTVAAPAAAVWQALGASLAGQPVARRGAALLGAHPGRAHGSPLAEGSTVPGFAVRAAVPGQLLVLAGRHRFSEYTLTFVLEGHGGTTRLTARTHARFPGVRGRAYGVLVIGSRAHRVLTRRWLRRVAQAAARPV